MRPGHRFALCVDSRAQAVVVVRAIHVVLDVFLARPDHLHRPLHLLGNLHGAHRPVELEAAPESATEQMIVDADLLPFQAGDLHDGRLRETRNLRADPDVAAVLGHLHGAVHRLHRRVRQKRLLVDGVDLLRGLRDRCGGIAVMPRHRAGLFRRGGKLSNDVGRGELRVRSRIPLRSRGSETLLGRPGMNGDDRDGVVQADDLTDAGHRLRLRFIDRDELSAEGRRNRHDRELHSRRPAVDAELRAAVDLAGGVETPMRRSDQLEIGRLFERDVLGHRQLRGGIHQLAIAELAAGGAVHDHTLFRATGGRVDVPTLSGCTHEHDASRRACATQRDVGAANRRRTAGHLHADQRIHVDLVVGRRVLDRDFVDVDLELFGDQHRNRGIRPLSHLDDGHHERDLAGAIDAQKRVRRERRIGGETVAHLAARGKAEAKHQSAADRSGRGELEKVAARGRYARREFRSMRSSFHTSVPVTASGAPVVATPAACLIAARIRT